MTAVLVQFRSPFVRTNPHPKNTHPNQGRTKPEQNSNKTLEDATKGKLQSTVEPVFGTLTQFLGLRKVNTIGIEQANKVMHMSAVAYNVKKYLKFTKKLPKSSAKALVFLFKKINGLQNVINFNLSLPEFN